MHGMRTFTSYLLLIASCSVGASTAYAVYSRNMVSIVIAVVSFIVAVVCIYGTGYFSGWINGHEENRTIYRHTSGE